MKAILFYCCIFSFILFFESCLNSAPSEKMIEQSNDFFYEEDETWFYEKNETIWSVNSRSGYTDEYETDRIYWIPADSETFEIEKIHSKNKPILDFIKLKQKEENEAIEKDLM